MCAFHVLWHLFLVCGIDEYLLIALPLAGEGVEAKGGQDWFCGAEIFLEYISQL